MARKVHPTPVPLKITRWERADAVDGNVLVITASNGLGLFMACQFGNSPKTQVTAEAMVRAYNVHEDLVETLEYLYQYLTKPGRRTPSERVLARLRVRGALTSVKFG